MRYNKPRRYRFRSNDKDFRRNNSQDLRIGSSNSASICNGGRAGDCFRNSGSICSAFPGQKYFRSPDRLHHFFSQYFLHDGRAGRNYSADQTSGLGTALPDVGVSVRADRLFVVLFVVSLLRLPREIGRSESGNLADCAGSSGLLRLPRLGT